MTTPLYNPVYHALISGDKHLSNGDGIVKYFDETVSPYVGFPENYTEGFDVLFAMLPAGRLILHATPLRMKTPAGWKMLSRIEGLQMVLNEGYKLAPISIEPVPLQEKDVPQMIALAQLTKPGPFGQQTILFGHYHGIFDGDKLVAMTGQRLHVQQFTEISAVCTHPDHLGKGYANALLQHQIKLIHTQGKIPFLHVRKNNDRAVGLYLRLGFTISRTMHFYFMKRRTRKRAHKIG